MCVPPERGLPLRAHLAAAAARAAQPPPDTSQLLLLASLLIRVVQGYAEGEQDHTRPH